LTRVVFRKAALRDLEKIYTDIRDQNGSPVNALRFVERIRGYCEGLMDFPERGMRRDDIRPGLRIVSFERVIVIAIEVKGDKVSIGRIFYARRNYERLLKRGPF
jgi:toxin ParE1/3/4